MQNLTAKYNYLYNAKCQLLIYEAELQHEFTFNHQNLLPLYVSPQNEATQVQALDRIITKAQFIISEKSYSNYIADSYLLLAKAQYLKGNYFLAEAYYSYVAKNYSDKPEIIMEALSGEARSLLQVGNLNAARPRIDSLEAKLRLLKKPPVAPLLTLAQYHIFSEEDQQSIFYLEQALKAQPEPRQKDICRYVLAQLYERQKNFTRALAYYTKVKNPPALYFGHAAIQQGFKGKSKAERIINEYSPQDPDALSTDTTSRTSALKTAQFAP